MILPYFYVPCSYASHRNKVKKKNGWLLKEEKKKKIFFSQQGGIFCKEFVTHSCSNFALTTSNINNSPHDPDHQQSMIMMIMMMIFIIIVINIEMQNLYSLFFPYLCEYVTEDFIFIFKLMLCDAFTVAVALNANDMTFMSVHKQFLSFCIDRFNLFN